MERTLRRGDPEEAGMSPDRIRSLRAMLQRWVADGEAQAIVALLARRGVVVLHEAVGRSGPEPHAPAAPLDLIFPIASMTKPITATAVMLLVEDGRLGLNRPVHEYVPEFVGAGKDAVMLHHLLTHTSGLRDQDLDEHALAKLRSGEIAPGEPSPLDVFPGYRHFGAVHDAPLWKPPGAEMAYSSSYNYGLLAEVVRRVTGQPPDQFAQERVLGPLGMASTSYTGVPPERIGRVVRRSADSPLAFLDRPDLLARVPGPAGAYSTALDLAQLVQMFLDGGSPSRGLLSPAAAAEMTRNQIPGVRAVYRDEVFPEASWGYGWGIQGNKRSLRQPALLSLAAFSHGGAGGSFMWGDPTYDLVGVYLSVVDATYPSGMEKWAVDLFADAATTAVLDR